MSSSSLSQVTSGLGLPRVTQGSTALDSTKRVTLVGWRLICGSEKKDESDEIDRMQLFYFISQSLDWVDITRGRRQTYSSWAAEPRSSWQPLRCRWWRGSSTLHCPSLSHEGCSASVHALWWCTWGHSTWWDKGVCEAPKSDCEQERSMDESPYFVIASALEICLLDECRT